MQTLFFFYALCVPEQNIERGSSEFQKWDNYNISGTFLWLYMQMQYAPDGSVLAINEINPEPE